MQQLHENSANDKIFKLTHEVTYYWSKGVKKIWIWTLNFENEFESSELSCWSL